MFSRSRSVCALVVVLLVAGSTFAATQQAIDLGIQKGLAYLATNNSSDATQIWYPYASNGTLAATASAALAFIEEGHLPGDNVIIDTGGGPVAYGDVVGKMCTYIFNQSQTLQLPWEHNVFPHHAEDYNNDDVLDDGGNGLGLYFYPGNHQRDVYTNGIVAPVVWALGNALGQGQVIDQGAAAVSAPAGVTNGMTYGQVMQDLSDWYAWGQVEPNRGNYRGGWRYTANHASSDNSTAQWGALTLLMAQQWGLQIAPEVLSELALWAAYIQNPNGGSGYDPPNTYVNQSKTGGLLLELALLGKPLSDPAVQKALTFLSNTWNAGPSSTWYGNLMHPYAMWSVYKGLEVYGLTKDFGSGVGEDFKIGFGMPGAPGGITIGQDWDTKTSVAGDWYSHYCDRLLYDGARGQAANGSWPGYSNWTGALAIGWNINILNAAGAPEPVTYIPEPLTMFGAFLGLGTLAGYIRKRRTA